MSFRSLKRARSALVKGAAVTDIIFWGQGFFFVSRSVRSDLPRVHSPDFKAMRNCNVQVTPDSSRVIKPPAPDGILVLLWSRWVQNLLSAASEELPALVEQSRPPSGWIARCCPFLSCAGALRAPWGCFAAESTHPGLVLLVFLLYLLANITLAHIVFPMSIFHG